MFCRPIWPSVKWLGVVCGLLLLTAACTPAPKTTQAPPPPPPPTPHPATGAQEAAVQRYPDLGVPGSAFNKTFVDLYADKQMNDPYLLARPEWPMVLADQTAAILHVNAGAQPTPTPNPSWIDKKRQEGNKLETPAYDKKRGVVHSYYYTPRPSY